MSKTIYLTTPLYYVNAAPHIGHSYTQVAADCMARYSRLKGMDTFLLTGTDEHGQKIAQAAAAAGQPPQAFVDGVVRHFEILWKRLNIGYDDFIRTTQARHVEAVQRILAKLRDDGALTRSAYQGWYCTPDETFWTDVELGVPPTGAAPLCPTCGRALEPVEEQGWHLPLRAHQPWLLAFVKAHPRFVQPQTRYNELMSVLEGPLPESLCITRPKSRVAWGIEVPFDPSCVVYVWIDALLNYITVPGYRGEAASTEAFRRLWPANIHFIGKDILRHHALYWPILLHALGFPDELMPSSIFAHGHWKVGEQKMSKSLGNIIDPLIVMDQLLKGQPYAADIYRYFLLREVPFGQDGSFSDDGLLGRLGAELGNDLGNLINRTCSMVERYAGGRMPPMASGGLSSSVPEDQAMWEAATGMGSAVDEAMGEFAYASALEAIMAVVSRANRYIEESAPWKLAKDTGQRARLDAVLRLLAETIRLVAILLQPFMPSVAEEILRQLGDEPGPRSLHEAATLPGLTTGRPLADHPVLFPRMERQGG